MYDWKYFSLHNQGSKALVLVSEMVTKFPLGFATCTGSTIYLITKPVCYEVAISLNTIVWRSEIGRWLQNSAEFVQFKDNVLSIS